MLLSLDAAFGVIIAVTLIIAAGSVLRQQSDAHVHLALSQAADAVMTVIAEEGTLESRDAEALDGRIREVSPFPVQLRVEVSCLFEEGYAAGESVPGNVTTAAGVRYFVITSGEDVEDYCEAQWRAWTA